MRKPLIVIAVAVSIVMAGTFGLERAKNTQASPAGPPAEYTGGVIVKFKSDTTLPEVAQAITDADSAAVASSSGSGLVLLDPAVDQTVDAAVAELKSNPDVAIAEPDVLLRASLIPNDALYSSYQWNLPLIGAPTAWNTSTGNANVIIAVIDTGVESTHPDLSGKITTGVNAGYNFVANNTNTADDNSHGTFVASIAAANTNNSIGMAGVCWSCKVMPVKVLDSTGSGSTFNVAQGIDWAVSHGADVINLSLGGGGSSTLQTSVDNAWNAGVVVVAASGNDNGPVLFPAAYSNAIAVGSVQSDGARSSFSNFGPELDIVAPGTSVLGALCTCNGNPGGYGTGSGTSFSSPTVAGVAGLLIASGTTDKAAIRSKLLTTATDGGAAGFDNLFGWGRVDAAAAISTATPTPTDTPTSTATPTATVTPDATGPAANITSPTNGAIITPGSVVINATATDPGGMQKVRFWVDATYLGYDSAAPFSKTWDASAAGPGSSHVIKIEALDNSNNSTIQTITATIEGSDGTPPTASITSPVNDASVSGVVVINATASDAGGIQKVRFWVDSTYLSFDATAPYSKTWDSASAFTGSHIIKIEAIDNANNSTIQTITVNAVSSDVTPPTTTVTVPTDGATVSGTVTLTATAADAGGIQKVRFWVDSTYLSFDTSSPYQKTWDTTLWSNGVHVVKAQAVDLSNNESTIVTVAVSVSN